MTEPNPIEYERHVPTRTGSGFKPLAWLRIGSTSSFSGALLLLLLLTVLWFFVSPLLSLAAFVVILLLEAISAASAVAARKSRAMHVLGYVEQAVRLHLPLPEMLGAAARGEKRATAKRLVAVGIRLSEGATLSDALALGVPELPERELSLVGSAARNGTLAPTLARLIEEQRDRQDQFLFRGAFQRTYFVLTMLVLGVVIWALSIFVFPKFRQIFRDFSVPIPWVTNAVDQAGALVAPTAACVGAIGLIVLFDRAWGQLFFKSGRRVPRLRELRDRIVWHTPFFGAGARDHGLADVCRVVADATRAGRSLDWALAEAASPHLNGVLRERVETWGEGLARGRTLQEAARDARLPSVLVGTIANVPRGVDASLVFSYLARYYHGKYHRVRELVEASLVPVIAILAGSAVLVVALAMFVPLMRLADATMPYVIGF